MLAVLGVAVFVVPFACSWPDGLEMVAARFGFHSHAQAAQTAWVVPAPDYKIPGLPWAYAGTVVAGVAGTMVVFGLACLLGRLLVPSREGLKGS